MPKLKGILLPILILSLSSLRLSAQSVSIIGRKEIFCVEEKAVKFFLDSVVKHPELRDLKVNVADKTNGRPSQVFWLAGLISGINVLKDSIPDRRYVDSLENVLKADRQFNVVRNFTKKHPRKRGTGHMYEMEVYNAVTYRGESYVQIDLNWRENKVVGNHKIIFIKWIDDKASKFYLKGYRSH